MSPNFKLRARLAQFLLDAPWAEYWAPLIVGRQRDFPARSPAHGKYWTLNFPTSILYQMAQGMRMARNGPVERIDTPTLLVLNPADQVVSASAARAVLRRWGGPVDHVTLTQGPGDDAFGHVMAGDILSPAQTVPLAERILAWARAL